MSGSDIRRSDIAWKRVVMSFIDASCATWMRIGWLAAATTASAWSRTISIPLHPRHSPLSPQWHSCGRKRSNAACSSDMSAGPAILPDYAGSRGRRESSMLSGPVVHGLDLVSVVVQDDLALDVQLEGKPALRLREILW